MVRHGTQVANTKLIVSSDASKNTEVRVKISEPPAPVATTTEATSAAAQTDTNTLAVGSLAPEFETDAWTDGKTRKMFDYRGKVVVLDFWGTWCSPCVNAIPAMQAVADRFKPQGVVFLGIHTADGDVAQINKLKEMKGWSTPSCVDRGTSITDGKTCSAYGIRGYPSIIIVDKTGRVAYNSGIRPKDLSVFMAEMGELAKENGIPWPIDEKLPEEQLKNLMNSLLQVRIGREIERAL